MMQRPFYNPLEDTGSGIGGPVAGGTAGSVLFVGATGLLAQDNANFFWDDTNNRLLIGTNTGIAVATGGNFQVVTPAIASTAEVLATFRVSDDSTGLLSIENFSSSNTAFLPQIRGTAITTNVGLTLVGQGTTDSGTTACIALVGRIGTSTTVTSRNLFELRNVSAQRFTISAQGKHILIPSATTSGVQAAWVLTPGADTGITSSTESNVFRIDTSTRTWAAGNITTQRDVVINGSTMAITGGASTITTAATLFVNSPIASTSPATTITNNYAVWFEATAVASTAEKIALFTVSDDTVGRLEIMNASGSASRFDPMLQGTGNAANAALVTFGLATTDTGSTGVFINDARTAAAASVNTRPTFVWRNFGTNVMAIQGATASSKLLVGDIASAPVGYAPTTTRNIEVIRSGASGGYVGSSWSNSALTATVFEGLKSRSTTVGTMTIVQDGDPTAFFLGKGSDGSTFISNASIAFEIDGTPGTNDMPGRIIFNTTPDGSATLAERMRIDSSGRVGIGTAPTTTLQVQGTAATNITISSSGANTLDRGIRFTNQAGSDAAYIITVPNTVGTDTKMQFYVGGASSSDIKLLVNDDGVVSVNNSSPAALATGGNLQVTATAAASTAETLASFNVSDDSVAKFTISNSTNADSTFSALLTGVGSSTSTALNVYGRVTTDTGTNPAVIFDARTVGDAALTVRPMFSWRNVNVEVMQLTAAGNLKIAGTAVRGTTEGTNHLDIFDGTAPVGTLANGISLYSTAGELRVMDAAGNATLLSPHEKESNYWIYDSVHTPTGKKLKIDVEQLLKFINKEFGLNFVHES